MNDTYKAPSIKTLGTVSEMTLYTLTKTGNVADGMSAVLGVPGSNVVIQH